MALPTSGAISMDQLRSEFGISGSISFSQVYRGGSEVPDVPANNGVTKSGAINLGGFRGGTNNVSVSYQILGGGGGGGFGNQEDAGNYVGGTYAAAGGATTLSGAISVSAAGGAAGASINRDYSTNLRGTAGQASSVGAGGSGGYNQHEQTDGLGSYAGGNGGQAAGGGGAGGDPASAYDAGGYAGSGGGAGAEKMSTVNVPYKSTLNISVGAGGAGGDGPWGSDGGRGGDGYARITRNYNSPLVTTYTTSGSRSITI